MNIPGMLATPSSESRPKSASIEVIGVGLGRTGTTSLWKALDILGFGPAYHPMQSPTMHEDFSTWADMIEGKNISPEAFDKVLHGYRAAMDAPIGVMAKEIYTAYPKAKYILTVRDPGKWEHSVKTTVLVAHSQKSEIESIPKFKDFLRWADGYFDLYHGGRLATHCKEELHKHNEYVKSVIPADQLLIFDVKEGWGPLAEFLGVPKPDVPFPHLNDSVAFHEYKERAIQ